MLVQNLFYPADKDLPLWHEVDSNPKDNGRKQLDANRHKPRSIRLALARSANEVRSIPNPVGDHDAETDSQLLERNERTSKLGWSKLGVVERHNHAQGTDTHTGDESSTVDVARVLCARLNDHTDTEDKHAADRRELASEYISDDAVHQDAEPCTKFEDGGQQATSRWVGDGVRVHHIVERRHVQDLTEHSLVVLIHVNLMCIEWELEEHTAIDEASQRREYGDSQDVQVREEASNARQASELGSFGGEGAMAKVHRSRGNHDGGEMSSRSLRNSKCFC